ncbi:helix-turn-helix domain-containing protein [Undibacterium sp. Rencai35W]|uniref:helix-turn-helix domain-containing protein n=1 Tax=Undibacterium sp. Rencai35W TaxID=3413046 RepID=UPI003BF383C5
MDIASRLDQAMIAAGLRDQIQLAKVSGISTYKINRVLSRGTKSVNAEDVYQLAKACKVSVAWLISGEETETGESVVLALIYRSEEALLSKYRQCDDNGKGAIHIAADAAMHVSPAEQNLT